MKKSSFSERLSIAMKEADLKSVELASYLKVDTGVISRYLSNTYKPKDEKLEKIAKILGVNELWLQGYDVPKDVDLIEKINKMYKKYNKKVLKNSWFLSTKK